MLSFYFRPLLYSLLRKLTWNTQSDRWARHNGLLSCMDAHRDSSQHSCECAPSGHAQCPFCWLDHARFAGCILLLNSHSSNAPWARSNVRLRSYLRPSSYPLQEELDAINPSRGPWVPEQLGSLSYLLDVVRVKCVAFVSLCTLVAGVMLAGRLRCYSSIFW